MDSNNTHTNAYDIQHKLFRHISLAAVLLSAVFTIINTINFRPIENILFGLAAFTVCLTAYLLAKKEGAYTYARLVFFIFFTFCYLPLGYWTSPGSSSAYLYIVLLMIFITTLLSANKREYFFPFFMVAETLVLLRTEVWFPDHYYTYTSASYRIKDISLNYTIVALGIIFIVIYMYHRRTAFGTKEKRECPCYDWLKKTPCQFSDS